MNGRSMLRFISLTMQDVQKVRRQGRSRRKTGKRSLWATLRIFGRRELVQQKVFGFAIRRILHSVEIGPHKTKARHAQFKIIR